jgi:HK97 gp10 family phage protein
MALPRSVTRVDRAGGVTFTSNVDAVQYTINELCRAALRDVAKMLRKKMILKLKKLPGMKKHRRIYKSTQYWVRRIEADLQIGARHDSWYGAWQELGTKNQPKRGIIRNTVFENISEIKNIQSKYLSGINTSNNGQSLIDESEARSGDGEE